MNLTFPVTIFKLSSRNVAGRFATGLSAGSKKAFCLLGLLACLSPAALGGAGQDAYVHRKGDTWTLGTLKVERTVGLHAGRFVNDITHGYLLPENRFDRTPNCYLNSFRRSFEVEGQPVIQFYRHWLGG